MYYQQNGLVRIKKMFRIVCACVFQAAMALWVTILRFMGDMAEPKYHMMDRDNTSVMSKVSATLGRNFIKSKEFQEAQMMGMDPVSCFFILVIIALYF